MFSIDFGRADARTISTLQAGFRRRGLRLVRSRAPAGPHNLGGFRLTDKKGRVIAGHEYDLMIRDARTHLRDYPTLAA